MILIATTDSDLIARCSEGLRGNGTVVSASVPDQLCEMVRQVKPALLLLDFYLVNRENLQAIVRIKLASPRTRILALNVFADERIEIELLKCGVRGCCTPEATAAQIGRAAFALMQGEYWIRRSLMSRLVEQHLTAKQEPEAVPVQPCFPTHGFTIRESEIALLVSQGNSNKQIARRLEITERTVKSHLTEIFRKAGVNDRLSLALKVNERAKLNGGHDALFRQVIKFSVLLCTALSGWCAFLDAASLG